MNLQFQVILVADVRTSLLPRQHPKMYSGTSPHFCIIITCHYHANTISFSHFKTCDDSNCSQNPKDSTTLHIESVRTVSGVSPCWVA